MRDQTRRAVEQWWSGLFGVEPDRLWREVTVTHAEGRLARYGGWYVAWREGGVHVSAPSDAETHEVASLRRESALDLQEPAFWAAFGHQRGLTLRGPATHAYLEDDPGPTAGVRATSDLDAVRAAVSAEDWEESGFADAPPPWFELAHEGRVVAAANLQDLAGTAWDIGVLVVPGARGRGLAAQVGRHAASVAIRDRGVARWSARTTNVASVRAAERLGFEPYVTQLALRRGS